MDPANVQLVLLMQLQNAMNAAEITDKLGLHSLRQRAWVGSCALYKFRRSY